ncbi:MAG TPA: ATP-dependent RNA helicase HrpA [Nocardioidaceae bacterium]|nr:ATP-dependent RNA helicase HrpA [Nocardioidaceae bacterium]
MSVTIPAQITYPEHLPVTQRREDIAAAIRDNQVVIVAGETGSGKTTQLPKICLELGRGQGRGVIGHTQPRRIAARTVAERIAEELGTALGEVVGYKVRFTDRSSEQTTVKVMTDGILLAEIQRDRDLRRYDTIIIDEAHERSLNIDFILGYLKRLLPRRPDLKVIITSATIDPERFAAHFGGAPVIEVSGRTYPVEVRYRELVDDQTQGITDAVRELLGEGPGDILVFLSGEREIRDAADALKKLKPARVGDAFDVLPLYSRLSSAEQHRVFAAHSTRRVILATNVAETSLTVPGVRFVIDTGLARISRFSARTKVQRLPIEPISQASANQRKGRCGRVADGICIRLYAEEDFDARPEFTDPEILRTNLASVILQMIALGLGDVARFPFMEPPDTRSIQSGVQVLEEIGAIHTPKKPRLTPIGKKLSQLPVDPRLAKMIIEADSHGCLREVVTITAALSIQDPRERPTEQQELADSKHRRFADPSSDFAGMLNLWRFVKDQQAELSSSAFRRLCKADFLNYLRIREWQDLDAQLRQVCKQLDLTLNKTPSAAEAIHRSLLAGLLSQIGMKDVEKRDYLGARGTRFSIFPGSALAKKQPAFVMSAELVQTTRLWGRVNAGIDPAWAESAGAHLVRRSYSEPHWEKKRGAVMALEKVTLYGVPIVSERKVNYGRIDPEVARELFIRHALVQGEWTTQHRFFHANARVLQEAGELEERARRRDIVVDDESLFAFYDARVGADVVSAAHFDTWWKAQRRKNPELLTWTFDTVVHEAADDVSPADFPDVWRSGEAELPLRYSFDPGTPDDGVTVDIPVTSLLHVESAEFSWPVPGLRRELVVALIRSLPKRLRVNFVPAPEFAKAFLEATTPGEDLLLGALERHLLRTTGIVVHRSDWGLEKIPSHLRPSFRVVSEKGDVLGQSKDLEELKRDLRSSADVAVSTAGAEMERRGITHWDFGELPQTFTQTRAGHEVKGYPALVDEGASVAIKVLGTPDEQATSMRSGLRRLLMLAVPSPTAGVLRRLSNADKLVLGVNPHGSVAALLDDCYAAAVDVVVHDEGGLVWDEAGMERLGQRVKSLAPGVLDEVVALVSAALAAAHGIDRRLSGRAELAMLPALTDMKAQWAGLVYPGFVADAGREYLRHYPRYFAAMGERLDRLVMDPRRDARLMASMAGVQAAYSAAVSSLARGTRPEGALREVRWLLEELRVGLWAQHLKTPRPISVQRVERALRDV